jgi:hypothetical protein
MHNFIFQLLPNFAQFYFLLDTWLTKQTGITLLIIGIADLFLFFLSYLSFHKANPLLIITVTIVVLILVKYQFKYIERLEKGTDGEDAARRELEKLPPGFSHLNDFNYDNRKSVDIVVIGNTGIFTLEVKNYRAREITCQNDYLFGDGKPFEKNIINQAYAEKKNLEAYLLTLGMNNIPVYPVVVFANRYTKIRLGSRPIKGVHVIGIAWLQKVILGQQHVLTPEQCTIIYAELKKQSSII